MGHLREKGNNSRVRRASSNKIVMKLEHAKLDFISGVNFTADDAPVLETERDAITERIKVIDQALDELNENIEAWFLLVLLKIMLQTLMKKNATEVIV